MSTVIEGQANYNSVATQASAIPASVKYVVPPATFVFWAGFDGTRNDADNPQSSGDAQSTAIGALRDQILGASTDNVAVRYYKGVGTPETLSGSSIWPREQAKLDAKQAYDEYAEAANSFLLENPTGSVTAMLATFSRGTITGALFAEKLYVEGLVFNGAVLIPPGEARISALLSISPVSTLGGEVRYPPNIDNFTEILADSDYRLGYQQDLYAGESQVWVTGNHCDIGGCYAGGIGSILQERYTEFFDAARSGMIGPVLPSRQYGGGASVDVHRETVDILGLASYPNGLVTGVYGDGTKVDSVTRGQSTSGYCTSDGSVTSYITMKGEKVVFASVGGITQSVTVNGATTYQSSAPPATQRTLNADGSETVYAYDSFGGLLQTNTTRLDGTIEQISYDGEQVATSVVRTLPRAADGSSITNFYDGTGSIQRASVSEQIVNGDSRITITTTVKFDAEGVAVASTEVVQNAVTGIAITTDRSLVEGVITGRTVTVQNFGNGTAATTVYGESGVLLSSSETSQSGGFREKRYVNGVPATETKVVQDPVTDTREAVTAIYSAGQISSLAVTPSVGATHYLDLLTLTATERKSYGFHTQQEVASRLGQLGLADTNQFMQNGFAAAGEQNAGLNDLQVEIGGTKYFWNNNLADLTLTNGGGWSAAGNGALASPGAPYCLAPIVSNAILYIGGAMTLKSPLVLDLDGDGVAIDLTHAYNDGTVFFDIDADGFAERVGWVKADDGLLAMDANGNGRIDDITELYGDDQMPAFQKLRLLDTNGDSRIDASDVAVTDMNGDGQIDAADGPFARLRVWQDANQDGITQEGELKTLASLDIQSISTNDHNDERWANENYISSSTTYTRLENGIAVDREIADVHFLNDNANTWQLGAHSQVYGSDIQIDLEAILLPLSRGYGTLPSLHLAMSANPELKRMVRELAYLPLDRLNEAAGRVGEILLEWAGVRGKDPASHATGDGPRIDGRKVDFVEQFTGLTWAQRGATSMVGEDASIGIKKTWNGIEAAMLHRMLAQGALHAVMPNASYDFATDTVSLGESLSAVLARAATLAPSGATQAREFWTLLGGILVDGKEELGQSTAAINDAVSMQAGQSLYLGEHVVAPSNFGDPDWGLYTGNGTSAENLVGKIFQGDAQANSILGTGAGEYFFGGAGNDYLSDDAGKWNDICAAANDAVFAIRRKG